eukprot:m.164031 g.164031  ORF g.164031 m.164031 type:complete len:432 (+) comp31319_c0_seq1:223-1518(+)
MCNVETISSVCELLQRMDLDDETISYVGAVIESEYEDTDAQITAAQWTATLEIFVTDSDTLAQMVKLLTGSTSQQDPNHTKHNQHATMLPTPITMASSNSPKLREQQLEKPNEQTPKAKKKKIKKQIAEPKRVSSSGQDELGIRPNLEDVYFNSGYWETELDTSPLTNWSSAQVSAHIKIYARRMGTTNTKEKIKAAFMKVASIVEGSNIDGALVDAGGTKLLFEHICGFCNDTSYAKMIATNIMQHLTHDSRRSEQWGALGDFFDVNQTLLAGYQQSFVGDMLSTALSLYPIDAIEFSSLVTPQLDVLSIDACVGKHRKLSSRLCKVVSVAKTDEPHLVRKNFIYAVDRGDNWCLVASVDFEKHGEAPSGHWHINRACEGELIPHFYELETCGKGNVFHGDVDSCPLWWLMIPHEKQYWIHPVRYLLTEH